MRRLTHNTGVKRQLYTIGVVGFKAHNYQHIEIDYASKYNLWLARSQFAEQMKYREVYPTTPWYSTIM